MNAKKRKKDYKRTWYEERKTNGLCVRCGQPAEPGKTKCLVCKMDDRERARKKETPEQAKRRREREKGRYKERKAQGVCVQCGKRPADKGVRCRHCAAKENNRARQRRAEKAEVPAVLFGDGEHCSTCGKPTINGNKLCPACYERSCKALEKARKAPKKRNPFKEYNEIYWKEKQQRKQATL